MRYPHFPSRQGRSARLGFLVCKDVHKELGPENSRIWINDHLSILENLCAQMDRVGVNRILQMWIF